MGERMPRTATVRDLAVEAGVDVDEVLIAAWDAGLEDINNADDRVPARAVNLIRSLLGLPNPKQMQRLSFWQSEWGLDREQLIRRLADEYDVHVPGNARVLPKGALRRLRSTGGTVVVRGGSGAADSDTNADTPGPFTWSPPGHSRQIEPLSVDEVCQVHEALVHDFLTAGDPISPAGVRDQNLLQSAVSRPGTSIGEVLKYSTVEAHGAALLHSLVHNHPFYNGNKRTALVSLLVFLDRNSLLLTCTKKDLFSLVLRVARHRLVPYTANQFPDREVIAIAQWICANSRTIRRGERPLKWRELRRILEQLSCSIGNPLPGNKIKIERVERTRLLGIPRTRRLKITTGYRSDGMEVDVRTLNFIRRELRLDEQNGYDSEYFYGKGQKKPDEFIGQYRTLLKRLSRL